MQKTTVYRFEYFDRESRSWRIAPDMATEQAINAMGAVILRASATEVGAERVGSAGILRRDSGDQEA